MNIAASLLVVAALFIYLLGAILMVNVVFGWTVLGWIAALIWAWGAKVRMPKH